jgi:hypothetical protein
MRAIAGILAFFAIVMIALIMLVIEWLKKLKSNKK